QGERERAPAPFSTNNLDLTRTEDDALPFLVFDAKDIQLSGAPDLQRFLQDSLPQNFNAELLGALNGDGVSVAAGNGGNPAGGMVDMRGWGANETVFLLNGVRMPKAYTGVMLDNDRAAPDLRGIPLASIERIEILSSAGSAIYGTGATGGIINIITRR